MKEQIQSLSGLALKGVALGAKFFLIFYMGKYFSVEDLGVYGIFVTTITLCTFVVGFDFYRYSGREILSMPNGQRASSIRDQFLFYLFTYLVFLPLIFLVFLFDVVPHEYLFFFYFILIFDHLSQELYRLFTLLSRPVFANILFFFRSGFWVYLVLILWLYKDFQSLMLEHIWWGWLLGAALSVLMGIIYLFSIFRAEKLAPINWRWYSKGTRLSIFFLGSTVAYKIIEFSDRYMLDYWIGKEGVGVYTFYNQIANIINIVVFTAVLMIIYPSMVEAYQQKRMDDFRRFRKKMTKQTVFISIGLVFLLFFGINPILQFVDKASLYQDINTYYLLLLANVFFNMSYIPHFVLYAYQKDYHVFYITVAGSVLNIGANVLLIPYYGVIGAAWATLLSFILIGILKYLFAHRFSKLG